jgi:hypothetical protein
MKFTPQKRRSVDRQTHQRCKVALMAHVIGRLPRWLLFLAALGASLILTEARPGRGEPRCHQRSVPTVDVGMPVPLLTGCATL